MKQYDSLPVAPSNSINEPLAFTTRDAKPGDLLVAALEAKGWRVEGHSMLTFRAVPVAQLPPCDWVFAYSARGIEFLLTGAHGPHVLNQLLSKESQAAAMGPGTAAGWRRFGIEPAFVGTGVAAEVAEALAARAGGQRIAFVGAANGVHSVQGLLGDEVIALRHDTYASQVDVDAPIPSAELYVATSLRNYEGLIEALDDDGDHHRVVRVF